MVSSLKATDYDQRLKELGLSTLKERRHQANMQMVHKILHRENDLDPRIWFETVGRAGHATRSGADPYNIKVRTGRLEVRRHFFWERVTNDWNKIPADIKSCPGAAGFKVAYKKFREILTHAA
jgi:hypothetical protein